MGRLLLMSARGDEKLIWDPKDARSVQQAQQRFQQLRSAGHLAYKVDKRDGSRGTMLTDLRSQRGGDHPYPAPRRGLRGAEWRAARLLCGRLSPEQRRTWRRWRYFDVQGKECVYRLHRGTARNIQRLVDGRAAGWLCAHPQGVPVADVLLAQKLAIEADEAAFLRIAISG